MQKGRVPRLLIGSPPRFHGSALVFGSYALPQADGSALCRLAPLVPLPPRASWFLCSTNSRWFPRFADGLLWFRSLRACLGSYALPKADGSALCRCLAMVPSFRACLRFLCSAASRWFRALPMACYGSTLPRLSWFLCSTASRWFPRSADSLLGSIAPRESLGSTAYLRQADGRSEG